MKRYCIVRVWPLCALAVVYVISGLLLLAGGFLDIPTTSHEVIGSVLAGGLAFALCFEEVQP